MKNALVTVALLTLSGCSSMATKQIIGNAVGSAANTQVGYDKFTCNRVRNQCVEGYYEEWRTSDGVPGCSCTN